MHETPFAHPPPMTPDQSEPGSNAATPEPAGRPPASINSAVAEQLLALVSSSVGSPRQAEPSPADGMEYGRAWTVLQPWLLLLPALGVLPGSPTLGLPPRRR